MSTLYTKGQMPTRLLRDKIREYAKHVGQGFADKDLTKRQARLVEVMLNLSSNANAALAEIATPINHQAIRKHLGDIIWEARPLFQAFGKAADDDFAVAIERAMACIDGILGVPSDGSDR